MVQFIMVYPFGFAPEEVMVQSLLRLGGTMLRTTGPFRPTPYTTRPHALRLQGLNGGIFQRSGFGQVLVLVLVGLGLWYFGKVFEVLGLWYVI